jgi:hypothetical protein
LRQSRPPPEPAKKYFEEAGGDDRLGHYDLRFFHGELAYDAHLETLQNLIRSYLTTLRSLNLETWIAHGTLLGWWWNGRIMPWDYDLDVQVRSSTLQFLGENYNRTLHEWVYDDADTGETKTKEYLLDINPHHDEFWDDPMNVIDARWIDTHNGLYVDITALVERSPNKYGGNWVCKDKHQFLTTDIWPLRQTVFEGVAASIPYAFEKLLSGEYKENALTETSFNG